MGDPLVSRTRCSVLHAAAQSRDPYDASLPGLTRHSIFFERLFSEDGWMRGSSPRMTIILCFVAIPVLRSITPQERRAASRPGNGSQTPLPARHRAGDLPGDVAFGAAETVQIGSGDLHGDAV